MLGYDVEVRHQLGGKKLAHVGTTTPHFSSQSFMHVLDFDETQIRWHWSSTRLSSCASYISRTALPGSSSSRSSSSSSYLSPRDPRRV